MTSLPVYKDRLITWKRWQLGKQFHLISVGNRGRSFRIRQFYLRSAPPSGRNRDFAISGLATRVRVLGVGSGGLTLENKNKNKTKPLNQVNQLF